MTDDLVMRLRTRQDSKHQTADLDALKAADRIEELEGAIRQIVFDAIQLARAALEKKQ